MYHFHTEYTMASPGHSNNVSLPYRVHNGRPWTQQCITSTQSTQWPAMDTAVYHFHTEYTMASPGHSSVSLPYRVHNGQPWTQQQCITSTKSKQWPALDTAVYHFHTEYTMASPGHSSVSCPHRVHNGQPWTQQCITSTQSTQWPALDTAVYHVHMRAHNGQSVYHFHTENPMANPWYNSNPSPTTDSPQHNILWSFPHRVHTGQSRKELQPVTST